jgi:hypothetical protein
MTKNMIFAGVFGGAILLVGLGSLMSSDDDDNNWERPMKDRDSYDYVATDTVAAEGELIISQQSGQMVVETDSGVINCTRSGGRVSVQRESGKTIEIFCD